MMRFGPPKRQVIAPDVVPNGGKQNAIKQLYNRQDRPWNGTAPGREFSRPAYMAVPPEGAEDTVRAILKNAQRRQGQGQGQGQGQDYDDFGDSGNGRRMKSGRPSGGPRGGQEAPDSLEAFKRQMAPPPMKAGKVAIPYSAYPASAEDPYETPPGQLPIQGLQMKMGKGFDTFDPQIYEGQHMTAAPQPSAMALAAMANVSKPVGKMKTNMRKKDTFGAYPAHMSDPYKDNPLGESGRAATKGKPPFKIKTQRVKPTMPIVNVWSAPAGLQTKAGVMDGTNRITGARTTFMSDKGRLGTTV